MSVVVQDTSNPSYACFVQGSNNFFADDLSVAQGYADGFLTDYLVHHTHKFAVPWLLKKFVDDAARLVVSQIAKPGTLKEYTVIEHAGLELQLMVDLKTHLPHAIRSLEHHELYGWSTSDVILRSWAKDFLVDSIAINPEYSASYFEGHPPPLNTEDSSCSEGTTPVKPARSLEYPRSEIHEFFELGLWGGPFGEIFNESDVVVKYPYPAFKNIMTVYIVYPDYVQLLVEHETGFIITDAPPHRSKIMLSWLAMHHPEKNITHVVPSHHHRDHAGGVQDYVRAGATLVIPSVAKDFYDGNSKVPGVQTYDEEQSFIFIDGIIECRSYWKKDKPHAEDWSFAFATKAQPTVEDPSVLFNADVVNPGIEALRWAPGAAREFLLEAIREGVPRSTLLVGAHGSSWNGTSTSEALVDVARTIGLEYPHLEAKDWIACGRGES